VLPLPPMALKDAMTQPNTNSIDPLSSGWTSLRMDQFEFLMDQFEFSMDPFEFWMDQFEFSMDLF
jgi:hypothetical protein